ncbi:MAG: UMP kinase [Patescibacteria group bacterium]|nr:UMP kinase [Patescibacteria group bacterium]
MFFFDKKEPPIIISVGGSLIVPNGGVDTKFLSQLNYFIRSQILKGKRFMLISGGGKIARHYQDAGKQVIGNINNEDLDWLGIHATRFNAHLLRTIFQDVSHPRIITNYDKKIFYWKEPIAIGAGWKPGWSTDYDAVILARDYKANLIINLSNVDGIYDKDPKKFKNAKIIEKITWEEVEKIIGNKWTPGLNAPFDPVATPLAKKLGLTVIVASGHDFNNLEKIIEGKTFRGTVITPFRIDSSYYDRDYYMGKKGGHKISKVDSFFGEIFHNLVSFYRAFIYKITLNPKTALELGCGLGTTIKYLRFFGVDAKGIDFSKTAYNLAKENIKPYIILADATNLPFKNNQFDLVYSHDLLEKMDYEKIQKTIKESIRVSKKYIVHKIFTKENIWYKIFHKKDFSDVSFFYKKYWEKIFFEFKDKALILKRKIMLPSFIETKFVLKKK